MARGTITAALATCAALCIASPSFAGSDDAALTELVQILKNEGVLDDAQYNQLTVKAAERESRRDWYDRISLSGDLRARYEGFWFAEDAFGDDKRNRHRGRYRWRLKGKVDVNDYIDGVFRLASGSEDNRSTNQTLGSSLDFDSDPIVIDLAYLELTPFANGKLPSENGSFGVEVGKVPNPYVWKVGKDFMLWDHDISLEGVNTLFTYVPMDEVELFGSAGYYVFDENSSAKDPNMIAAQIGAHVAPCEDVEFGLRGSYFGFRSLNPAFITRAADSDDGTSVTNGGGNILDGFTGSSMGGHANVFETSGYLELAMLEGWPVLVYGSYSVNTSAERSFMFPGVDKENHAWGVGLEVGDKKERVKVGAGYWHIEANAFPSMFIDSDLFDGRTNRHGYAVYGSRQLFENVDLNVTGLLSNDLEKDAEPESVEDAHRVRLQVDMVVKF